MSKNKKFQNALKQERGITLIALVITIVILIILATIAIRGAFGDNGLVGWAKEAKEQTEKAELKERVQADILGEQAGNNGELTKGKFIGILNKYFNDVPTEDNFPEDLTSLILETKEEYGSHDIKISDIYNGSFPKTVASLKVGDKVYYDTGNTSIGNQGKIECTVLYDNAYNEANGTNYGIQIISTDVIKDAKGVAVTVPLGRNDDTVGGSGWEKAKNSYNNALKRLYDEAQKYLNRTYASSARCVGSDPADPDWDTTTNEAEYYTKEIAEQESTYQDVLENDGWYNDVFKNEDDKYISDYKQLNFMSELWKASIDYWSASRKNDTLSKVNSSLRYAYFSVRYVRISDTTLRDFPGHLCLLRKTNDLGGYDLDMGFRPVFTLNSDIELAEGDGVNIAYTLAP